jgi:hypothetical protein
MKKAELILGILSLLAVGMNLLLVPGGSVLTVLTLSTFSMMYFYFGFALFNGIRLRQISKKDSYKGISTWRILGAAGAGVAISWLIIGLMFKFQSWPGAHFNLGFGLAALSIVTGIGLVKYAKSKSPYYTRIFKRAAVFGGLGLILLIAPKTSWVEFKYRNHPAYVDALKKAMADPDNEALWENVEAERQKMNGKQQDE